MSATSKDLEQILPFCLRSRHQKRFISGAICTGYLFLRVIFSLSVARESSFARRFLVPCVVLSRKVDCDVCWRAAKLKITLKLAVAPSSLNTLLKNVPVLSEAFLK